MKNQLLISLFVITCFTGCNPRKEQDVHQHDNSAVTPADTVKKSIPKEEHAKVNEAHITIKYHSPAVRGRIIWGGLVPYDEVWVTGAHSATSFEIDTNFKIGEKEIPPGKYALFTIPGKEKWTFIINKNWDQHLADEYNSGEDVVRLEVTPEVIPHQERLLYLIDQTGERRFNLVFSWEKIQVSIPGRIL